MTTHERQDRINELLEEREGIEHRFAVSTVPDAMDDWHLSNDADRHAEIGTELYDLGHRSRW